MITARRKSKKMPCLRAVSGYRLGEQRDSCAGAQEDMMGLLMTWGGVNRPETQGLSEWNDAWKTKKHFLTPG